MKQQQKMQGFSRPFPLSLSTMCMLVSLTARVIFTPSLCVLLALGSAILGLAWVFLDFFAGMVAIDVYAWLPLIVLLAVMDLLMTEKWQTVMLTLPLLIVTLAGLYYLLLLIGLLALGPVPMIGISGMLLLIMLNGSILWVTCRLQHEGGRKQQHNVRPRRRFFINLPKTAFALALGGLFVKVYFWMIRPNDG